MMTATHRINKIRAFLTQIHQEIGLEFGIQLWDGSYIPADWSTKSLAITIADEGVIASLLRKPKIITLANLWVAKRINIINGTIFNLIEKKPKGRTRDLKKFIPILSALKTSLYFLFISRGGPWPLEGIAKGKINKGCLEKNKKNISYHYDLSNKFYQLWLDEEMVYSCGYFHDWEDNLNTIQIQKLDMICQKLRLKPGEILLDIGCGWGALCCYAAQHYGVKAHGVTLSEQQANYANEKIKRLNLTSNVKIELVDYTLIEGLAAYDKITSVGFFEHVENDNFSKYFQTIHRLLKPGGLFLHHAITRPGKSHAARTGKKPPEFKALIRYIFPGGELDYIGRTITNLELHGFEIHDVEAWREHYQRTCRFWHDRLLANYDAACLEVGEVKTRLWLIYLASCSITFERNNCGLYQTLASKRVKGAVGLPPTRRDLYI